jgi:pilus assembly protein Flp/PilA
MKTYLQKALAFIRDEEGASAIEYGLLVAMVALAVAGAGALIAPALKKIFGDMGTSLTTQAG